MSPQSVPDEQTDVVVIGAGQAGLAMSRCLSDRGVGHVVLERGRVAERWRSERWRSLRLLTPNWQSRLPGSAYDGPDPDGFATMAEVVQRLEAYARDSAAPIHESTTVTSVAHHGTRFVVHTDRGTWRTRAVVIATGACDVPAVPALAAHLPDHVRQVTPNRYRSPNDVTPGPVLVVGASATGVQLACELRRAGHDVTLAVGRHTRVPRRYRGLDVQWWLDRLGVYDERTDLERRPARLEPSLQLVGDPKGRDLDLAVLASMGVRLAGRLEAVDRRAVQLAADLRHTAAEADARLHHLLDRIDEHAEQTGLAPSLPGASRPAPALAAWSGDGGLLLDPRTGDVSTVVWATGYRRRYPWLHVPVLDRHGELRHRGGITAVPGLVALGLPRMRRRRSTFLDGVGVDAEEIADHLLRHVLAERPTSSVAAPTAV